MIIEITTSEEKRLNLLRSIDIKINELIMNV